MTWEKITYERRALFDDVWTKPVTKLAKDFGLSDVGLRKICVALDVPMPPRGYWAKLAAGTATPKPPLPDTKHRTTYERMVNVIEIDEVLETRIAKAQESSTATESIGAKLYTPPVDSVSFSPQAKLVMLALKGKKPEEGALTSLGATWVDISVSENLKERALSLVDRYVHELENLGATFENSHPPLAPFRRGMRLRSSTNRNCFILHGEEFFVRIKERITQEIVPPPLQKPLRAGARKPDWEYRPIEYRYIPTGKLYASIVEVYGYYERYKIEDSTSATIEHKVQKSVKSAATASLRQKVEKDIREERELVRKKNVQVWEAAKANKDALLKQLSGFEKLANDLDRARSLRRLIDEISASESAPTELVENLGLMALMANWLDPLVKAAWPEVDGIGDRNPYGSNW